MERQQIRKLLLITSLLLFPATLYYFSPTLIINAGLDGITNGSKPKQGGGIILNSQHGVFG